MIPPDAFAEVLRLFPGLGAGLLIGWYVVKLVRADHNSNAAQVKESHLQHLATKGAMIARLEADIEALRKERDRWLREATKKEKP